MHKSDFTYEQLGRVFRSYLSERFDGDAKEVSLTVETAERIILRLGTQTLFRAVLYP